MERAARAPVAPTPAERLYLARACELARRGLGSTAPNPPVGAVIVREGTTLGEGFHHARGEPHAEVEALENARARGRDVRGATLVVSLEPCNHHGLTPPCTGAIVEAGIARVLIGARDPNPRTNGAGISALRAAGVETAVAEDACALHAIEPFAAAVRSERPYVILKLAASLDGNVAPRPGAFWLTSEPSRERVRELRWACDAVMVGAGTIRSDDSQLTVRPPHARRRPYARVVACEEGGVPETSRVFGAADGYARTIVLAPAGARERFRGLEAVADCIYVGSPGALRLDLEAALAALKRVGIESVLCEGGPTLASALLAGRLVDRLAWFVAPRLLAAEDAVPALAPATDTALVFETVERSGDDLLLMAKLGAHV